MNSSFGLSGAKVGFSLLFDGFIGGACSTTGKPVGLGNACKRIYYLVHNKKGRAQNREPPLIK
jgi:hypothetical protein